MLVKALKNAGCFALLLCAIFASSNNLQANPSDELKALISRILQQEQPRLIKSHEVQPGIWIHNFEPGVWIFSDSSVPKMDLSQLLLLRLAEQTHKWGVTGLFVFIHGGESESAGSMKFAVSETATPKGLAPSDVVKMLETAGVDFSKIDVTMLSSCRGAECSRTGGESLARSFSEATRTPVVGFNGVANFQTGVTASTAESIKRPYSIKYILYSSGKLEDVPTGKPAIELFVPTSIGNDLRSRDKIKNATDLTAAMGNVFQAFSKGGNITKAGIIVYDGPLPTGPGEIEIVTETTKLSVSFGKAIPICTFLMGALSGGAKNGLR